MAGFSSTPNSYERVWDTTCYPPGAGVEGCRQVARRVHTLALVFQEPGFAQHKTAAGPDAPCLQGDLTPEASAFPALAAVLVQEQTHHPGQKLSRWHCIPSRRAGVPSLGGAVTLEESELSSHSPFPIFNFLCDFVRIWASCCDRNVLLLTVSIFRVSYMPPDSSLW